MKWKRRVGWALLVCGAFVVFIYLVGLGDLVVNAVSENWYMLLWVLGGGIAMFSGWQLVHSDKTPGLYSVPKGQAQDIVLFHATILRCLAERIQAEELRGRASCGFDFGETTHGMGCMLCEAAYPCRAIRRTLMKRLNQALRDRERCSDD